MEALKVKLANRLLELDFVKKIVYTRLFKEATDDVLATIRDDSDERAEKIAQEKLIELLSPIDPQSIVSIDKQRGIVYIGGNRAEEPYLLTLKSEAEYLLQTNLWKLIQETPKELAQKAMFIEGDNLDTMKKGRSMLYTLQTQKNIVDLFAGFIPKSK